MAKIRLYEKPFRAEDLGGLDGVQGYASEITPDYMAFLAKHPAYTVFYEGEPVGAGGIIIPWNGVGEAWSITLPGARRCARAFLEWARIGIRRTIASHNLHRVQCTVLEDYHAGRRWAVALGFKPECLLRFSGPNKENSIQFVMFPEGDN